MQSISRSFSSAWIVEEYDLRSSEPSARPEERVGLERKSARSDERRSASLLETEWRGDETAADICSDICCSIMCK